jgi:hypothetical protein
LVDKNNHANVEISENASKYFNFGMSCLRVYNQVIKKEDDPFIDDDVEIKLKNLIMLDDGVDDDLTDDDVEIKLKNLMMLDDGVNDDFEDELTDVELPEVEMKNNIFVLFDDEY